MAMTTSAHLQRADINVTPMIDVLLVLIILFMVIAPVTPRGLNTLVPQGESIAPPRPAAEIVITVLASGEIRINREPVGVADLPMRMASLLKTASGNVIFVRGDRSLEFRDVARVIDVIRGAGWSRIALMTS